MKRNCKLDYTQIGGQMTACQGQLLYQKSTDLLRQRRKLLPGNILYIIRLIDLIKDHGISP